MKTYNSNQNGVHLRNFVIEVSNNGKDWKEIDRQSNCSQLNKNKAEVIFSIKQKTDDFYRFVRLRQTGNSWYCGSGCYYFYLYYIEFFGKIREPA